MGDFFGPLERSDTRCDEAASSPPPLSDSGVTSKSGAAIVESTRPASRTQTFQEIAAHSVNEVRRSQESVVEASLGYDRTHRTAQTALGLRVKGLQASSPGSSVDSNAAGAPHSRADNSSAVGLGESQPDFPTPFPAAAGVHRGTSPGDVELQPRDPHGAPGVGGGLYALGNPVLLEGTDQLRSAMMMEVGNSLNVEGGLLQTRPRRSARRQIIVPGGEM